MRIGIDARFLGRTTGIGRYISELFRAMLAASDDEFVLFLRKSNWDEVSENKRIQKVRADIQWYTLAEQLELVPILDGAGCDIIHFPHWNVPVFVRTPYVLTVHDLLLFEHPSRRASFLSPLKYAFKYAGFRLVLGQAVKRAKSIIVPSRFTAGKVEKHFHVGAKTRVVYEGVSSLPSGSDLALLVQKGVTKPYILYVGNAYPHKNLENLITTVLKMREGGENINLVLVGNDDFYNKLKGRFGKVETILFYGQASDEELSALYDNAATYAAPALHEGFGLPGLEAMSHNLPVVAARSGSLPEIYGSAAEYFEPGEDGSLAGSLDVVLKNNFRREQMIADGRKVAAKFSWDSAATETLKIYRDVLER